MDDEKVLITEGTLDNIAEAIREKNGESDLYNPNQMPAAIRRIPTGQGGGSVVAVYPILFSGEHIADIVVDGDRSALYAPEPKEYTAGTGIEIDANNAVSVSAALRATISGKAEQTALDTAVASLTASLASKQGLLIPGDGITITNNVISADGTDVEANPTGTPTEELNTIRIGTDIYEIVGGGSGSGYTETTLYTAAARSTAVALSDSIENYDAIEIEVSWVYQSVNYHISSIISSEILSRQNIAYTVGTSIYRYYCFTVSTSAGITTFTRTDGDNDTYISKVKGIKYGGGTSGGGGISTVTEHYTGGTGITSRTFTLPNSKTPAWVRIKGNTDGAWVADLNFKWGDTVAFAETDNRIPYNSSYAYNVAVSYLNDTFTITGYNPGGAFNTTTSDFDIIYFYNEGGGGASAVSDLTDVSLSNLANGQILKYNSTTQKWENANESGGGSTLPFDIVINSTDNGIDLVYDDGT